MQRKPKPKRTPVKKASSTKIKLAIAAGLAGLTGVGVGYHLLKNKSKVRESIIDKLPDTNEPELLGGYINIYMVYYGYRTATLIEPANYKNGSYKKFFDVIQELKLYHYYDDSQRILVTKTQLPGIPDDKTLGKLLGFYCYNHDYSNQSIDRVGGHILVNGHGVYAEVCEYSKINIEKFKNHLRKLASNYKKLVPSLGVTMVVERLDSYKKRFQKLQANDIKYVKENIKNYNNDLANEFTSEWESISAEQLLDPFHKKIYENVYKGKYNKLYPPFTGSDENIREINRVSRKIMDNYRVEKKMYFGN